VVRRIKVTNIRLRVITRKVVRINSIRIKVDIKGIRRGMMRMKLYMERVGRLRSMRINHTIVIK